MPPQRILKAKKLSHSPLATSPTFKKQADKLKSERNYRPFVGQYSNYRLAAPPFTYAASVH
jgi:hypothetical protein